MDEPGLDCGRYTRAPDLPKMSFRYRVLLECGSAGVVLGMILGPMIPTPKEQLLDHYFGWFRIPYGCVTPLCVVWACCGCAVYVLWV